MQGCSIFFNPIDFHYIYFVIWNLLAISESNSLKWRASNTLNVTFWSRNTEIIFSCKTYSNNHLYLKHICISVWTKTVKTFFKISYFMFPNNSYKIGMTCRWVNDHFHFGWTNPLTHTILLLPKRKRQKKSAFLMFTALQWVVITDVGQRFRIRYTCLQEVFLVYYDPSRYRG